MKKPLPDRIADLKSRKLELAAQLLALEGKAKREDRKRDTRRKIVVGAAVQSEMERNPRFATFVRDMLDKAVTRPQDRESIFDLLPLPAPPIANDLTASESAEVSGEASDRLAG